MAMELEHRNGQSAADARETLLLMGGAALVIFGAGLILSTSTARSALSGIGLSNILGAAVPDLEKYMKIRGM
jgi:hypothetical protein